MRVPRSSAPAHFPPAVRFGFRASAMRQGIPKARRPRLGRDAPWEALVQCRGQPLPQRRCHATAPASSMHQLPLCCLTLGGIQEEGLLDGTRRSEPRCSYLNALPLWTVSRRYFSYFWLTSHPAPPFTSLYPGPARGPMHVAASLFFATMFALLECVQHSSYNLCSSTACRAILGPDGRWTVRC